MEAGGHRHTETMMTFDPIKQQSGAMRVDQV